jgi:acetyl esterase/lipase
VASVFITGSADGLGLISPIFADLSGLPPLIIQARTHEVLLDDAIDYTSDITPSVPHVFQAYHAMLDEAANALDRAGQLLSTHLASAKPVTA